MDEYTLANSIRTRAEKVMVTMLANESLKRAREASIIQAPWKILYHAQIKKVLKESTLPF
jgi:hypothetical protein